MFKKLLPFIAGLSFFSSCINSQQYVKPDALEFYDKKVDSKTVNKSEHSFPKFFDNFEEKDCVLLNEKSDKELMKSFFAKNKTGSIGKKYVNDMLEKVKKYDKDSLSELELAVIAVDFFRKDISKNYGKGYYTLKHEKGKKFEFFNRFPNIDGMFSNYLVYRTEIESLKDSTQTLDMFLSHESGKYEGDCDDFGRSLLTAYEMMKDFTKKGKDKFSSKLYNGLKRYRLIGLDIKGHAMNGLIIYSKDFTIATLEIIEPQIYLFNPKKTLDLENKLFFEENKIYTFIKNEKGVIEKRIITELYSSEVCYEQIRH